jgi:hypothetical protein
MQTDAPTTQPVGGGWTEYAIISGDPVVDAIIVGGAVLVALPLIGILLRLRSATRSRRLQKELRRHHTFADEQKQGRAKLAGKITATSSTGTIAGYEIVRQIEAVFTDGHPSPSQAVEALKAIAAAQGANAVINLGSERPPSGKCLARGDAVVVQAVARPIEEFKKATAREDDTDEGGKEGSQDS